MLECAELFVVALGDDRARHVFGRRTLPHMDLASVSCAIQNLWLAARAEGLGMGWVSIFDPDRLGALLGIPDDAEPVAVLCLGPVPDFPDRPALEIDRWTFGRPLSEFVRRTDGRRPPVAPIAAAVTTSTLIRVSFRGHVARRAIDDQRRRCHQRQRRMRLPRR